MAQEDTVRRTARRARRFRSGDLALLMLIGALVLVFVNYDPLEVLSFLYNPWVGIVIMLLLLEFLWLKSTDRTRIYRLEMDRLRDRARRDERLLRRARDLVSQGVEYPNGEADGRPGDWMQKAKDLRRELDERL